MAKAITVNMTESEHKAFLRYLEKIENQFEDSTIKVSKTRNWSCDDCAHYKSSRTQGLHCALYSSNCASGLSSWWSPKE